MGGIGSNSNRNFISEEIRLALDKWARNPTNIRKASVGQNFVSLPSYSEFNQQQDNERAERIELFVNGSSIKSTIYRGIENLSEEDYNRFTTVGAIINQSGLSSWSTNKGIAVGHGKTGRAVVFVQQGAQNSRRLGNITGTGMESEVIMSSKEQQRVTRIEHSKYTTFVYTESVRRRKR